MVRRSSAGYDLYMSDTGRRILLAVEPVVLEGALAEVLSAAGCDQVVQLGLVGHAGALGQYDAAVVCTGLCDGIRSDVIITLPDGRGGAGTGSVRTRDGVHGVRIDGPEQVIDLLEHYAPNVGR